MREIKFRAWDKIEGEWLSLFSVSCTGEYVKCYKPDFINPDAILLQYTGLKDKNGTEIYADDLITHNSRNGGKPHRVIFYEELAAWCGDYGLKYPLTTEELEEIKVIGNINENPELLKEETNANYRGAHRVTMEEVEAHIEGGN